MYDTEQLRQLPAAERRRLLRELTALELVAAPAGAASGRRRLSVVAVAVVSCLVLAVWIGVLAVTLPRYYRSGGWRGAWVGFDIAMLLTFAATGWAAWRRRQALIVCLIVLATLLCCDAWFDVVLDARTAGFWLSLLSAFLVELPLAVLAAVAARRLIRTTAALLGRFQGMLGPVPPLRQVPLFGLVSGQRMRALLADPGDHQDTGPAAAAS